MAASQHRGQQARSRIAWGVRRARVGITLPEIVTVLTITGIVAGIALPRVPVAAMRLDAGARSVFTALQVAQRLAIARQCDVVVSFDVTGGTMRTLEDRNGDGAISIGDRVKWHPLQEGVSFSVPPRGAGLHGPVGRAIVGARLTTVDGMPSITFRRNGASSSDIEIYLALGDIGNGSRGVEVAQASGRPAWSRWSQSGWSRGGL